MEYKYRLYLNGNSRFYFKSLTDIERFLYENNIDIEKSNIKIKKVKKYGRL